jgi:hypothetical protein
VENSKKLLSQEELSEYYIRGSKAKPQPLSRTIVRRCYYDWLKKDSDNRPWEEVFEARLSKYKNRFERAQAKRSSFIARKIGEIEVSPDYSEITIKSEYHQPLKISTIKPSKSWVKKIVRVYSNRNYCSISAESLISTLHSNISTRVWI